MTRTRREFLGQTLALGCTAAASPLVTPVTLANAPGDNRLVVIVLRGAMDGLDVVQPHGDADLRRYRPSLSAGPGNGAHDLDGFFALHAGLTDLMPLWRAGELGFAHAVSTPYRDKRSHFDGQDMLENGSAFADGRMTRAGDGWLNRTLALIPGAQASTALAVGRERLLLLNGEAPITAWSPDGNLPLSAQGELLIRALYEQDPLFHEAAETALRLAGETDAMSPGRAGRAKAMAEYAAGHLRDEARFAAFSLGGWDTHVRQVNALPRALGELSDALLTLKSELGPQVWGQTCVMAVTEFGRTVAENGNGGTDHGTGGALVMAGGAVRGKQVVTDWPGLAEADLYERRDLRPTRDVRAHLGWAIHDLFGLSRSDLAATVFPGVAFGSNPRVIL